VGDSVIEVQGLTRTYGEKKALNSINVNVARGSVVGLLGANGAGKTTLIKHILGLLRAQQGSVKVFGLDPVKDPVGVLSRIGYLAEENDLPSWLRVRELLRYSAAFRPTWDAEYANSLISQFGLNPNDRLANLSKGQRARAGLTIALAFRPDFLLLDEPSSGLDPVVRRDILGAIIRTISQEGRTVIFSSHLLSEVEQVCDRVVMLSKGEVVLDDELDEVKRTHFRICLRWKIARQDHPHIDGAVFWQAGTAGEQEWKALWRGEPHVLEAEAAALDAQLSMREASLDDIFVALAAGNGK
jgi:ABC-2 type transport system ATP-binding protein